MDIIEFVNDELSVELTPVQVFILKILYKLKLNSVNFDIAYKCPIRGVEYRDTEVSFYHRLIHENRLSLGDTEHVTLSLGRRSGKDFLIQIISLYESFCAGIGTLWIKYPTLNMKRVGNQSLALFGKQHYQGGEMMAKSPEMFECRDSNGRVCSHIVTISNSRSFSHCQLPALLLGSEAFYDSNYVNLRSPLPHTVWDFYSPSKDLKGLYKERFNSKDHTTIALHTWECIPDLDYNCSFSRLEEFSAHGALS